MVVALGTLSYMDINIGWVGSSGRSFCFYGQKTPLTGSAVNDYLTPTRAELAHDKKMEKREAEYKKAERQFLLNAINEDPDTFLDNTVIADELHKKLHAELHELYCEIVYEETA